MKRGRRHGHEPFAGGRDRPAERDHPRRLRCPAQRSGRRDRPHRDAAVPAWLDGSARGGAWQARLRREATGDDAGGGSRRRSMRRRTPVSCSRSTTYSAIARSTGWRSRSADRALWEASSTSRSRTSRRRRACRPIIGSGIRPRAGASTSSTAFISSTCASPWSEGPSSVSGTEHHRADGGIDPSERDPGFRRPGGGLLLPSFDRTLATERTTIRLAFERGHVVIDGWIPTRLEMDGLVFPDAVADLRALFADALHATEADTGTGQRPSGSTR